MAWEKRGNREYYYQKRREGDRVISEYIGSGRFALLIAKKNKLEQERRWQKRIAERAAHDADRALVREVDRISRLVQTLTAAVLLTNGYHTHKGQWRKRRGAWLY